MLRYLIWTRNHVLRYDADAPNSELTTRLVHGYSDSDWARDHDTRWSTAGYIFLMAGGAVSWSSKIQSAVTLSSTEAEYIAASRATQEAYWLCKLLKELGHEQKSPTQLLCDNQGALALIKNPRNHSRTKHIAFRYHHIREAAENGDIKIEYCPTEEMTANLMTKSLGRIKHERFVRKLGMDIRSSGSVGKDGS